MYSDYESRGGSYRTFWELAKHYKWKSLSLWIRIMGVIRLFEYSTSLTLHRGSEFWFCFIRNRWKMATERKWCSWLKWSKFDFYQMSQHHTPPDSVQSHSDNPQAPHRHLTDDFQTPPHFEESEATGRKWIGYCRWVTWGVYQLLAHQIPPNSIWSHSDNPQTPHRHLPDTFRTPPHFEQSEATGRKGLGYCRWV